VALGLLTWNQESNNKLLDLRIPPSSPRSFLLVTGCAYHKAIADCWNVRRPLYVPVSSLLFIPVRASHQDA
jgi:hypothetical protein